MYVCVCVYIHRCVCHTHKHLYKFLFEIELKGLFLFCRGRYSVELHFSFLRMQGQANDFKIQYSSVVRLFVLPKVDIAPMLLRLWQPLRNLENEEIIYLVSILKTKLEFAIFVLFIYQLVSQILKFGLCVSLNKMISILYCNHIMSSTTYLVVITLDPPIRKGQTFYPQVLL